jgi:quercetin 2,3-dioxygenase
MIERSSAIDFQWPVQEPFIFCVHHLDQYPAGTQALGPDPRLLVGRDLGMDFTLRDGFRMYHGESVPGFPRHPHRGFETITIVRHGYVDHSDSLGAAGRYGQGDVQWMTAGSGVQHCEMFPLLRADGENRLELFQVWLNLPARSKMVPAWYKMLWSERIPRLSLDGGKVRVTLIAGELEGTQAIAPPPDSWAADPRHAVAIWLVTLTGGGRLTLPAAPRGARRSLYHFAGSGLGLGGQPVEPRRALFVDAERDLELTSAADGVEVLVLQAQPIGEPVVQQGPFVMNSAQEIRQAFDDFRRTQFGGWPWERDDQVHGAGFERFARYPDGTTERPG